MAIMLFVPMSPTIFLRLVIAGMSGDSGKTVVSLGLLLEAASDLGLPVQAFKKGPDYIDAAWLTWASGRPARNLDSYLMGFDRVTDSFLRHALPDGLNVIEGNRGLYDGADAQGTHSTAELAKALQAPVILVVRPAKVTRTAAAAVLGCQKLDPELPIGGVILNQVNSPRHERVVRQAIESATGVPVLGALPRAKPEALLPGRHLGLVTPEEHPQIRELKDNLLALVRENLDLGRILALARQAPALEARARRQAPPPDGRGLKIGYVRDSAFTFYYPENLEALEAAGAALIPVSALSSASVPADLDALYIGGGFPETHALSLCSNRAFLDDLKAAAGDGLPVYAECGGLMLLSRAIHWRGHTYPMAAVLPFEVEVCPAPQGHGYVRLTVDGPNPFFPEGLSLRGHEFHYSKILGGAAPTAWALERGAGCFGKRDGIVAGSVFAAYTHLHAVASPEWAAGLLEAARRRSRTRERRTILR